jgi:hypothetical protein
MKVRREAAQTGVDTGRAAERNAVDMPGSEQWKLHELCGVKEVLFISVESEPCFSMAVRVLLDGAQGKLACNRSCRR